MPAEPPVASPAPGRGLCPARRERRLRPIAGGTDLMVQITGELAAPPDRVLDIWRLDELRGISAWTTATSCIGALTTYTDIARSDAVAEQHLPALAEAAATIGAAQIQNRGTIGGNIVNASPAGDTLPVLLASDAQIVLAGAAGERGRGGRFLAVLPRDRARAGRAGRRGPHSRSRPAARCASARSVRAGPRRSRRS